MLVDQIRLVATIGAKLIGVVSWVSLRYYRRPETERSGHNWTHRPLSTTTYTQTQNTKHSEYTCIKCLTVSIVLQPGMMCEQLTS